jgi:hypothetical protein
MITEQINFSDSTTVAKGIQFLKKREGEVRIINIIYSNEQLIIHYQKIIANGNKKEKNHAL